MPRLQLRGEKRLGLNTRWNTFIIPKQALRLPGLWRAFRRELRNLYVTRRIQVVDSSCTPVHAGPIYPGVHVSLQQWDRSHKYHLYKRLVWRMNFLLGGVVNSYGTLKLKTSGHCS